MKAIVYLLLLLPAIALAQPTGCNENKTWHYDKTQLYWEYATMVDPLPTGYRLKAGTNSGTYTIVKDMPASQLSIPVSQFLPAPQTEKPLRYFVVIIPMDGTLEGQVSDECFLALSKPSLVLGVQKIP